MHFCTLLQVEIHTTNWSTLLHFDRRRETIPNTTGCDIRQKKQQQQLHHLNTDKGLKKIFTYLKTIGVLKKL